MYYLGRDEIRQQLGAETNAGWNGHSQILLFQQWLGLSADHACWDIENRARYAASLVTRADAELYCFSYPRFAVRAYLDDKHGSFINLRRTQHLRERIRDAVEGPEKDGNQDTMLGMIGDCVLEVPAELKHYCFVPCDSSNLYGNEKRNLENISSTPFVNYSDSSGSCAFAVAFMASALLNDHCTGLMGLTEMPFVFGEMTNVKEVTIGHVLLEDLCLLLGSERIGLCAYHQKTPSQDYIWDSTELTRSELNAKAVSSYVASGMPVILPCDLNLMHGHGDPFFPPAVNSQYSETAPIPLYRNARNRRSGLIVSAPTKKRTDSHLLLCLGVNMAGNEFVLHDPYGMPYLTADAETLKWMSYYKDDTQTDRAEGQFISVTPRGALLPLLGPAHAGSDDLLSDGCLPLAIVLLNFMKTNNIFVVEKIVPENLTFRLVDRKAMSSSRSSVALKGVLQDKQIDLFKARMTANARESEQVRNGDWVWLVFVSGHCLVIDATRRVSLNDYSVYNIADEERFYDLEKVYGDLLVDFFPLKDLANSASTLPEKTIKADSNWGLTEGDFKPSLITSFCETGVFGGLKDGVDPLDIYFKNPSLSMELYTFMQNDLDLLLTQAALNIGSPNPFDANLSVVSNLAKLYDERAKWVKALVQIIHEMVTRDNMTINICGLATFIPGATSSLESQFDRACQAMSVICLIAKELQTLGHTCGFIEMVMGSRVDKRKWKGGLGADSVEPTYMEIKTADLSEKNRTLYKFFQQVYRDDCALFNGVFLLELEPGPSFILNDLNALISVASCCRDLASSFSINVGLNMDIAHWMLAGINPSFITSDVLDLIGHCHICDSSCGHMDDSPLFDMRGKEAFRQWFEILDKRIRTSKQHDLKMVAFPYSGYVSLELECAKHLQDVQRSFETLSICLQKNVAQTEALL